MNDTGRTLSNFPAFAERLARSGRGAIVNIASGAGLAGTGFMSAYSSSKHALVGLTRSVAREVAEYGISANAVCRAASSRP